jgi:hypothetical protein
MKTEHRMGRNYLKGRDGDRINAVLAAAGYNFSIGSSRTTNQYCCQTANTVDSNRLIAACANSLSKKRSTLKNNPRIQTFLPY